MGVRPSMGSVGDAYDNAMAESFFASLECELIDRRSWKSKAEARLAVSHLDRGLVQPAATPLGARVLVARQLRKEVHDRTRSPVARRAARLRPLADRRRHRGHLHPRDGRRCRIKSRTIRAVDDSDSIPAARRIASPHVANAHSQKSARRMALPWGHGPGASAAFGSHNLFAAATVFLPCAAPRRAAREVCADFLSIAREIRTGSRDKAPTFCSSGMAHPTATLRGSRVRPAGFPALRGSA